VKKYTVLSLIILSFLGARVTHVKKLDWMDPYGRQAVDYSVWYDKHVRGREATDIATAYEKAIRGRQNHVDIVVNSSVYFEIESELDIFTQDLNDAGYSCQVDTISGMSHTALRSHLSSISGLVGAIFIGEIPVAWFETNGFGNWEEFPHDLYFCDFNGIYLDGDNDGIYDGHMGSVAPEIWVGRIYTRNLTWGNEVNLLKTYFHRNHLYRVDSLPILQRGLSFVDDDWSYWTTCGLDYIYTDVTVINDDYQTTAGNYRDQLSQNYEWIHICAHSSPWGHTFKYPVDQYRGTVFNYEIFTFEPQGLFYNLFACSGTRFVEENSSAGWYLFNGSYGLLAVGSTKTGSMLYFSDFYDPIGQQNKSVGDAFKDWFITWGETDWDWFYGMNILGDPTLKPLGQSEINAGRRRNRFCHTITDWEQPEVIATDPESDGFPQITANADGKLWLVWESGRSHDNGRSEIYSAYHDAGVWSEALVVGSTEYWDYGPAIGIGNSDHPVAVWAGWVEASGNYQYDIFYSVYDAGWSQRQLVHALDPSFDLKPALAKDTLDQLWVSWESRRNVDLNIYAAYYDGATWSSPQQVTVGSSDDRSPVMLVDTAGTLWIIYCRQYADRSEIWGSYHDGAQWVECGPISGAHNMAYHPAAALHGDGRIIVAWQTGEYGNLDIYGSYYDGNAWSVPYQITTNPAGDLFPSLITDGGGAVWLVYQSKISDDWEICARCHADSSWSSAELISNSTGADINPKIVCSPENELWVCWQSYAPGNWEIVVSHRSGTGITEQRDGSDGAIFMVSPSVFRSQSIIMTPRRNQQIKIYDSKGALNQILHSADNRMATWTPANIPGGVYFVVVDEGSKYITRKALFIK
jgi:hypothetical protein